MYRNNLSATNELRSIKGKICFVLDTCALASTDKATGDIVTEALCRLRFPKNGQKKRKFDIGIIPKEVVNELSGMRESTDDELSSIASLRYRLCSTLPLLKVGKKCASGTGNNSPTENNSTGSALMQLPSTKTCIWPKMRHFLRNNDCRILAHALYFHQMLVLSKKGEAKAVSAKKSCESYEDNSDSVDDEENSFESSFIPPELVDVEEVVLVTEDQLLATKAFAVYGLKAVQPAGLLDIMDR